VKVTLHIEGPYESREVPLEGELTVGRTELAKLVLDDAGLSRVNTTFFIDEEEVYVADENSLNGTDVNGEKITGRPRKLSNGDEVRIGSNTRIKVSIEGAASYAGYPSPTPKEAEPIISPPPSAPPVFSAHTQSVIRDPQSKPFPLVWIAAGALALFIVVFGAAALYFVWQGGGGTGGTTSKGVPPTPQIRSGSLIPVRVIDPLGGEDEDDLDDLIASWETEENPLTAEDVKEVQAVSSGSKKASELNVPVEFWKKQLDRALNHGASGAEPAGLIPLPVELIGGNVTKQKAKLAELIRSKGYLQPMDFADLARLRLEGKFLGELPIATEAYVLDVGGSASGDEFSSFAFAPDGSQVRTPITPDHPKYKYLKQLADNFDGQRYDLNNPADRKQMRMRLLRLYNKDSRKAFDEFTRAFYEKFKVPLRITSLTRSLDYQIELNKSNANSFKVSAKGSLPPHTSGCAFDVSRKNLTSEEQNFLMQRLSELERAHRLDSLREGSANACFHSFFYPDGVEPATLSTAIAQSIRSAEAPVNFPFVAVFAPAWF
jgi:hypothetical protein